MEFIITSEERLNQLIESAMRRVVLGVSEPEPEEKSNLNVEEAVSALQKAGYRVTKSFIYSLTYKKLIPFRKFGNNLIFNKAELLDWAKSRARHEEGSNQTIILAQSAKRKPLYSKK